MDNYWIIPWTPWNSASVCIWFLCVVLFWTYEIHAVNNPSFLDWTIGSKGLLRLVSNKMDVPNTVLYRFQMPREVSYLVYFQVSGLARSISWKKILVFYRSFWTITIFKAKILIFLTLSTKGIAKKILQELSCLME